MNEEPISFPARNPWVDEHPGPFQEGDRVRLRWGGTDVVAIVVEDRGRLGIGGKRLYGVRLRVDDVSDPLYTEIEPDALTLVARAGQDELTTCQPPLCRDEPGGFQYQHVFKLLEESLIHYGTRRLPLDQIRAELDRYKTFAGRKLTDDEYHSTLVNVVFYSGFRAATVTAKRDIIKRWFPDWRTVAEYSDRNVAAVLSDPTMIRNKRKIKACIHNARIMKALIGEYGSFRKYIASFNAARSFENLMLLKEELEARFGYLGGVTVYHFLTDIGMPVLKPDRVICRIFQRLGLIENDGQLLKTVIQGRKFAEATGYPIRYIDIVFVAYGQAQSLEFGIDRGICLKEPRCAVCGLQEVCRWYQLNKAAKP